MYFADAFSRAQTGNIQPNKRFNASLSVASIEAFLKKEHAVAVFFYLEKAYDTTCHRLKDLHAGKISMRLAFVATCLFSLRIF